MEFNNTSNYIFNGDKTLIEDFVEKRNENNTLVLGKFLCYISIPLCGDMLERGKARFENGIINSNYFNLIV